MRIAGPGVSLRPRSILRKILPTRSHHFLSRSRSFNESTLSFTSMVDRLRQSRSSIEEICSIEGVPGVSVGVLHQGEVAYTDNYGFLDKAKAIPTSSDTLYGVGSLTKSMISAGIGKLVKNGKFQWETPVRQLLPKFSHEDSRFADEVTIADLLSHRSGLAGGVGFNLAFQGDSEMLLPADCLFEIVHHIPHVAPIGERWMYCVWGYSIAGCLIEEVTQKPLHQYLQEELFDPLSMSRTTLRLQIEDTDIAQPYASLCDSNAYHLEKRQPFQKTFFEASGGVYSTVNDLLRWSKATLNAFQEPGITGGSVLKQIPEILRPQVAVDSVLLPGQYYSLGWLQTQLPNVVGLIGDNPDLWEIPELPILGVGSHPRDIIYHQGVTVGYFSFLALFPETKSAVVVLTNAMAMSDVAEWVARLLIEALFDFPERTNYVELSREGKRRRIQQFANMHADLAKEYAPETRLLPVDAYVGQYLNQTYNSILDVTLDPAKKDDLILAFQSRPSQRYGLRHLHGNVFEWALTHDESKRRGRYTVVDPSYFKLLFEVDPVGQVCEIVWDLDGFSTPGGVVFSRMNK